MDNLIQLQTIDAQYKELCDKITTKSNIAKHTLRIIYIR